MFVMDAKLHGQLISDIEELRRLVGKCSTEAVVGMCNNYFMRWPQQKDEEVYLHSHARQLFYLLGLLMATPEPDRRRDINGDEWRRCVELLDSIENHYAFMYWPTSEESAHLTDQWRKANDVAMPAFLHYLGAQIMGSVEQVSQRIQRYVVPFDGAVQSEFGLSGAEALEVSDWVAQHLQSTIDDLREVMEEEDKAKKDLLTDSMRGKWSIDRLKHIHSERHMPLISKKLSCLSALMKVSHKDLSARFGQRVADNYWKHYVARRGTGEELTYPTEMSIEQERPLFEVQAGIALCPVENALYWFTLKACEILLSKSDQAERFLRRRDTALEEEVYTALRQIFRDEADFLLHVYETDTLQFEHDLIVRCGRKLLVVESKASPPKEPRRDADRSYTILRRAFQSDTGIQKAYDQANSVRQKLATGDQIDLYDSRRNCVAQIAPTEVDTVYCICVTRDNFGAQAADLSLLLEKAEGDSYPWAVNILDLQNLADAWDYFGWGPERLCEYLDDRMLLHGKVFSDDELDYAGYFIRHGSLTRLVKVEFDTVQLDPEYSDIFDKIYLARQGGDPVQYAPTEPFEMDLTQKLKAAMAEAEYAEPSFDRPLRAQRQGRNEPCACGSGKKYKHCCLKRN